MRSAVVLASIALALWATAQANAQATRAPLRDATVAAHEVQIGFASLGIGPLELRGVQAVAGVNVGTRLDEVVVAAKLRLRFAYSPAMVPERSYLRVSLNGEVAADVPLLKEDAGRELERELVLDPRYFSDYNEIRFDLISHYKLECEDPKHTSLWVTLSPRSQLELTVRPLELRNELALLPAPFFDRRDNRRLVLPVVLPSRPSRALLRSAGVAASWFGMLADYRSARFPVSFVALPKRHAMVFATNGSRPAALSLANVQRPTISIIDHPAAPHVKLLVFQGRDEAQLQQAVEGLVLGNPVLNGSGATVTPIRYQRRPAYDAPRWLRTDRPVKLIELVDSPEALQGNGITPAPIRIPLRLPPDLLTWNRAGVPVDLRYRYTTRTEHDNSTLTVSIDNQLLRSYRLLPESEASNAGAPTASSMSNMASQRSDKFVIPTLQLTGANQLQFQFKLGYLRRVPCSAGFTDNSRQAVDPDSTIDISQFQHYTALPNLALFATAGYPFTRYADLGETAIVLPDTNDQAAVEQLLFVLGRMGRHTGVVGAAYQLLDAEQAQRSSEMDLLILGTSPNRLLGRWAKEPTLELERAARKLRAATPAVSFVVEGAGTGRSRSSRVDINAAGSLGALLSFESPLRARRTVVALTGTDAPAAEALVDALEDAAKVTAIRGSLAIVRGGTVQSYAADSNYYVGSLPWWQRLWFYLVRHPRLLQTVTWLTVIAMGLLSYAGLRWSAARRLQRRRVK